MNYEVLSMVGDYPVESQPFWNKKFRSKKKAIEAAKEQQTFLSEKYPRLFTVVSEVENDTYVEWLTFRGEEFTNVDTATEKFEELVG